MLTGLPYTSFHFVFKNRSKNKQYEVPLNLTYLTLKFKTDKNLVHKVVTTPELLVPSKKVFAAVAPVSGSNLEPWSATYLLILQS